MGRGESKTGGYSSRGGFVTTGVGQGDGLSTKLSRRPRGAVGLGGPWRMSADDEFAGTYLSRVNKGYEEPEEIPMFPEQDPDWIERFLTDLDVDFNFWKLATNCLVLMSFFLINESICSRSLIKSFDAPAAFCESMYFPNFGS